MQIGSLFSGIGGLELGLEWAGIGRTVWQVEKEPYALQVLARHWPDAVRFDNVCTVGAHNLPHADVICGGFPCQDVSLAGKGAGLDGARSGLWSEFRRILGEVRPNFAVIENVTNLLAIDGGAGFARVLSDLAALGFDAWWDCLPASAVGSPQQRDRIFVVAYADHARLQGSRAQCELGKGRGEVEAHRRGHGSDSAGSARRIGVMPKVGGAPHGFSRQMGGYWPARPGEQRHRWEPAQVSRPAPYRSEQLQAYGNAVSPVVGYIIGHVIRALGLVDSPTAGHGGRRIGAGRPPQEAQPRDTMVSVRASTATRDAFARAAAEAGISQADLFAMLVRSLAQTENP